MRVGVIGLGVMGKNHARVLGSLESVDEVFLYDPMAKSIGPVFGCSVTDDLSSFLENKMDYCVVSSPTSTHKEMALALARHSINALIEKPLASSESEAREIHKIFVAAGLFSAVGHVERFNPAVVALKDKLSAGLLGKIFQISTRRIGPYSGRIRDVGVVKDLASHDIDLVLWISGAKYESLDSRIIRPLGNNHEDALVAIGTLSTGAIVNHTVNWLSPAKERVTMVLGEKGVLVADTLNGDLYFYENGSAINEWSGMSLLTGATQGASHRFELKKIEPLVSEHLSFQKAITKSGDCEAATLEDGIEVLRIAELMSSSPK